MSRSCEFTVSGDILSMFCRSIVWLDVRSLTCGNGVKWRIQTVAMPTFITVLTHHHFVLNSCGRCGEKKGENNVRTNDVFQPRRNEISSLQMRRVGESSKQSRNVGMLTIKYPVETCLVVGRFALLAGLAVPALPWLVLP